MTSREKWAKAQREYRRKHIIAGLCSDCPKKPAKGKRKCLRCLARGNQCIKNKRLKALEAYGNKCNCCGEPNLDFLTFDHVNNDGYKRRPRNGYNGTNIYYWLADNNYPKSIQVLCYNCNCGRARRKDKICPHKIGKK